MEEQEESGTAAMGDAPSHKQSFDLGHELMQLFKQVLPLTHIAADRDSWETQGWLWLHMAFVRGTPQLVLPVRKGSHHNLLNMQGMTPCQAGSPAAVYLAFASLLHAVACWADAVVG